MLTLSLVEDELLLALLLWFVLVSVVPLTRYLTVVQGASTMLSWSMPTMFAPLRLKTPITRNGTLLMRISLPIGDISWKQVLLDGVSDDAYLVAVANVAVAEHFACRHFLPIADLQIRRRDAVDVFGHAIAVSINDLRSGTNDWGDAFDGGALAGDFLGVLRRQRNGAAGPLVDAAGIGRAGEDHNRIGPHAGDALLQGGFRALSDLRHGDDRRHGNDDPQGRKPGRILLRLSALNAVRHVAGSGRSAIHRRVFVGASPSQSQENFASKESALLQDEIRGDLLPQRTRLT